MCAAPYTLCETYMCKRRLIFDSHRKFLFFNFAAKKRNMSICSIGQIPSFKLRLILCLLYTFSSSVQLLSLNCVSNHSLVGTRWQDLLSTDVAGEETKLKGDSIVLSIDNGID